jgi:hypothetical protein
VDRDAPLKRGDLVRAAGQTKYVFAGSSRLDLFASEIASYQLAVEQDVPSVYVVLKPQDDGERIPAVHLTTAAPDEAEAYLEGDECIVEAVPMPRALLELTTAFIASHRASLKET